MEIVVSESFAATANLFHVLFHSFHNSLHPFLRTLQHYQLKFTDALGWFSGMHSVIMIGLSIT